MQCYIAQMHGSVLIKSKWSYFGHIFRPLFANSKFEVSHDVNNKLDAISSNIPVCELSVETNNRYYSYKRRDLSKSAQKINYPNPCAKRQVKKKI